MKTLKFIRIVARQQIRRCGVVHPTHARFYPKSTIDPNETAALSARIKEMGGELVAYFPDRNGNERTSFTREEIAELKRDPMLVVDEIDVEFAVDADETETAPPKNRRGKKATA